MSFLAVVLKSPKKSSHEEKIATIMKSQKKAKYFLEILTIFIHIPKNGETEAVYIYYAFFGCMKKYLKHCRPKVKKNVLVISNEWLLRDYP